MLESLDGYDVRTGDQAPLRAAMAATAERLRTAGERSDRSLVRRAEALVASAPAGAFRFSRDGMATLELEGRRFEAGRFSCRSVGELLRELPVLEPAGGRLRLFILTGTGLLTDIGALQASAPPESMFQVASQFNCLESPGPYLTSVESYFSDPTQGPRASISAFPGTLLRHYRAPQPTGGDFVQRDPSPQLNLLHRVVSPSTAEVVNGYLLASNIKNPEAFGEALAERFEDIEVGVQESTEVVFGAGWDGPVLGRPMIGQILTSTLAAGGYGRVDFRAPAWERICRQLQRAAYLGTVAAAAATAQRRVVLTLIGGGVFENPASIIWESLLYACDQVAPRLARDLTVIVNGRELSGLDLPTVKRAAQQRGGDVIAMTSPPR